MPYKFTEANIKAYEEKYGTWKAWAFLAQIGPETFEGDYFGLLYWLYTKADSNS